MKKSCKFAFFFTPLFCCLFLQSCNSIYDNVGITETTLPTLITSVPDTTSSPKDTETTVFPEATSKSASKQETEETLDDILDQLEELDSILDGY